MPAFPPITVRQPRPFDIVDDPVEICGVGTGFEGVFNARVRDGKGVELSQVTIQAGGTGILANYHAALRLGRVPATSQGTIEVFEISQQGNDAELNKVVVPVVFGRALYRSVSWLRAVHSRVRRHLVGYRESILW